MAFKATQRSASRKKLTTQAVEEPNAPASEVSSGTNIPPVDLNISDLVGAPIPPTSDVPLMPPVRENNAPQISESIAPVSPITPITTSPTSSPPVQGGGYQPRRYANYGRGDRDDRVDRPDRGGYRYNRGGGSGSGGPRRDFGRYQERQFSDFVPAPGGNGYTQDISVPTETVKGILDLMPEGHGFLRPKFTPSDNDVYISQSQIRRFLLRNGDQVEGQARRPKDNERYWGLLKVEKINAALTEEVANRPRFEDLVPIYPNKLLTLETGQLPLSTRIIDLIAPIGFGQRGLVVSPPKAGKTTILKEIAAGVTANFPDAHLMAALIGERPEEVTDLQRSIKGEVLASNFDQSPAEQTRVAEVALDRAKRLVEMGKDVVILLDSITRLARAYNLVVNPSGRTLSGGFDPAALYPAKKFLGAARCVEAPVGSEKITGGSLTVIGTALVETGSRMDDLIYEEFKGTGNMELHLSRILQERRVFPAIDLSRSGTRHDELLLGEGTIKMITTLRHMLSLLGDEEKTAMLIDKLGKTKSNQEFLDSLSKGD